MSIFSCAARVVVPGVMECYNNLMKLKGFFKSGIAGKIGGILGAGKDREEILEELEEVLVLADISVRLVERLIASLRKRAKLSFSKDDFLKVLREELVTIFSAASANEIHLPADKNVILVVGINGSGKTTTTAKLAHYFQHRGKRVLMAASDTFRAAGGSQLVLWGEKLDIPVIRGDMGADPGSVVYNSLTSLTNKEFDLLLIDTAGRVQTRENLMKELEKLYRIIQKQLPGQPAETLLVVDATMGQNTLDQARRFSLSSEISGLVLAKLDGTAKGGTIINIIDEMKVPVKFAGIGEDAGDLVEFSADDFIDALFADE